MDIKRISKHLWIGGLHVRKILPAGALYRITQAIAQCEDAHHGEIRFAVEGSLHLAPLLKGITARERAVEVFSQLKIWDTEENNGVLIYLLVADRTVEILADRGVHAKVGHGGWGEICRKMETEFRQGNFESGVIDGIRAVSSHLENNFPRRGPDLNELPDAAIVL